MIESILSAWSFAGVVSKFYSFLGGVFGITVVGTILGAGGRPSAVLAAALQPVTLRAPESLATVSAWFTARDSAVTPAAAVIAVMALLWSAGFLARNVYDFDKVRGPATAWIALAVMAEASGRGSVIQALLWAAVATVAAVAYSAWRQRVLRSDVESRHLPWIPGRVAGALWGGAIVTLLLPLLGLLHAAGGMTASNNRSNSVAKDEG